MTPNLTSPAHPGGRKMPKLFWLTVGLMLIGALLVVVAPVLLNPQNPAFNPKARAELEQEARQIEQSGQLQKTTWQKLVQSASVECYFKSFTPQEFLITGILPDELVKPNTNQARWYLRFPANFGKDLFGEIRLELGVISTQQLYGIVNQGSFRACQNSEAARARSLLGL